MPRPGAWPTGAPRDAPSSTTSGMSHPILEGAEEGFLEGLHAWRFLKKGSTPLLEGGLKGFYAFTWKGV